MAQAAATSPQAIQSPPAAAMETKCSERDFLQGYYYPNGRKTFDEERYSALALRLNTAVYKDFSGDARASKILQFGERVRIINPGEGTDRIQIKDSTAQPVGWVDRSSVLCGTFPITDGATGLYKRVVVRTDTAVQGQVAPKILYQTPNGPAAPDPSAQRQRCQGPCAEVSRFQWYFIYGEINDHYLISADANLESSSGRLMG